MPMHSPEEVDDLRGKGHEDSEPYQKTPFHYSPQKIIGSEDGGPAADCLEEATSLQDPTACPSLYQICEKYSGVLAQAFPKTRSMRHQNTELHSSFPGAKMPSAPQISEKVRNPHLGLCQKAPS